MGGQGQWMHALPTSERLGSPQTAAFEGMLTRLQGASGPSLERARYLSGLPVNYEGMLDAFSLKYGRQASIDAMNAMMGGRLTLPQMRALETQTDQAGREYDDLRRRELIRAMALRSR